MPKQFILYDSRAATGNTDDATVLAICDTNKEAQEYKGEFGGMSCYSYDTKQTPGNKPNHLINETFEWNWSPKN